MEALETKTAILVDGGYYRKRVGQNWKSHTPEESAEALIQYCRRHLREHDIHHNLYRIFYYDCPPFDKQVYNPLTGKTFDFSKTDDYIRMNSFLNELKQKRKVALRLGKLDTNNIFYGFTYDTIKKLCNGTIKREDLDQSCLKLNTKQKGVDMKIGIDIASLSYKKQVDQIVLIAGDSDFVPAAKLARREGIDFILDTMGMNITLETDLLVHIDGLRTCGDPYSNYRKDL